MTTLLLDTNLLIGTPDFSKLPADTRDDVKLCTSALCYAELSEGRFSSDPVRSAETILRLSELREALGEGLPFGEAELAAYQKICATAVSRGRALTRNRRIDMMIAATALANGLVLATRNIADFAAVIGELEVIEL